MIKRLFLASLVAILAGGGVLAGCSGLPTPIPVPDSEGAKLYRQKCSGCHSAPHPKRHTFLEWRRIVAGMERHAGERLLDAGERAVVLDYLREYARDERFFENR